MHLVPYHAWPDVVINSIDLHGQMQAGARGVDLFFPLLRLSKSLNPRHRAAAISTPQHYWPQPAQLKGTHT